MRRPDRVTRKPRRLRDLRVRRQTPTVPTSPQGSISPPDCPQARLCTRSFSCGGRPTVVSVSGPVLFFLVMLVVTGLWLRGYLDFGSALGIYRKIRLAALLWVTVIAVIALLHVLGIREIGS